MRCLGHLCLLSVYFSMPGCGDDRPDVYPVSGVVTYQGKPVEGGKIVFYPQSGLAAMASIEADGHYQLTTFESADGAVVGPHRVTVQSRRAVNSGGAGGSATATESPEPKSFEEELKMGGKSPSAAERMRAARRSSAMQPPIASVEWIVPQKYSRRHSSLIDVHVDEEDNTIDIRLPLP